MTLITVKISAGQTVYTPTVSMKRAHTHLRRHEAQTQHVQTFLLSVMAEKGRKKKEKVAKELE